MQDKLMIFCRIVHRIVVQLMIPRTPKIIPGMLCQTYINYYIHNRTYTLHNIPGIIFGVHGINMLQDFASHW